MSDFLNIMGKPNAVEEVCYLIKRLVVFPHCIESVLVTLCKCQTKFLLILLIFSFPAESPKLHLDLHQPRVHPED